jgi:protein associated with RNAse G/E
MVKKQSSYTKVDLSRLTTKCKKCNKTTKLYVRNKQAKKLHTKTYYYNLMTRCEDCKVNYYVDCSKCYVRDNNLLDLLDVMEERVNPATKLQSVTFSEDIDNKDKTMDFSKMIKVTKSTHFNIHTNCVKLF